MCYPLLIIKITILKTSLCCWEDCCQTFKSEGKLHLMDVWDIYRKHIFLQWLSQEKGCVKKGHVL